METRNGQAGPAAVNFYGALYAVLAVLPHMLNQKSGHLGIRPRPGWPDAAANGINRDNTADAGAHAPASLIC